MKHDWYATFAIESRQDVDDLVGARGRYAEITDVAARAALLSTALGVVGRWPDAQGRSDRVDPRAYAQVGERGQAAGLRGLVRQDGATGSALRLLRELGIQHEIPIDALPAGSFHLRMPIMLGTPWLSRDDIGLYVIDNPVRKDHVFGVPTVSPAGWKGMLRWTATKVCLEPLADRPDDFAPERLALTRLFGSEKGGGEEGVRALVAYLDELCPNAAARYRDALRPAAEGIDEAATVPRLRGRLHFLPTFFDRMGMEVLNPHDRRSGAGTGPIYIGCAAAGASGVFEVVYVPWPGDGIDRTESIRESTSDLDRVVRTLRALCLDFGISAKRSSGYGLVRDGWGAANGILRLMTGRGPIGKAFDSFSALAQTVEMITREAGRG